MKERPQSPDAQILFYLLNEIFEIFKSPEAHDDSLLSRAFRRYEALWQTLQQRLDEITSAGSLNATSPQMELSLQDNDNRHLHQQLSMSGNQKRLRLAEIAIRTERAAESLPDGFQLPICLHSHEPIPSLSRSSCNKRRKPSRSSCPTTTSAPPQVDLDTGWPQSNWNDRNPSIRTAPLTPRSSASNASEGYFSHHDILEIAPSDAWDKGNSPRVDDALHEFSTDWSEFFNI
jgi:hypothetical protein